MRSARDTFRRIVPLDSSRMAWLDFLRASAVLLVMWDHFTGDLLKKLGRTWTPNSVMNALVFEPLAITQYGGFLGVTIFFMISGYIITVVLARESPRTFVLRRVFRIFPLLAVMILVVVMTNPPQLEGMSAGQIVQHAIENLTLTNYLHSPQLVLIGIAWTLAVELAFYAAALLLRPLAERPRTRAFFPLALILMSALFIATARVFGGGPYFQFSVYFLYVPIFAIGSLLALRASNQIRPLWAWASGVLAYGVFLFGTTSFYPQFLSPEDSYPVTFAYAVAIFGIVWFFRDSIRPNRFVAVIALLSYSIYLVHGVVGRPLLTWLVVSQGWTYSAAFLVAVLVTFVLSALTYLTIERPSNNFARRITSKASPQKPVESGVR